MPWVPASSVLCPPPPPGRVERRRRVPKLVERPRLPSISTHLPPVCTRPGPPGPGPPAGPGPAESPGVHCRLPPRLRHLHPSPPRATSLQGLVWDSTSELFALQVGESGHAPSRWPLGTQLSLRASKPKGPSSACQPRAPGSPWWGPERRGRDSEHELLPCELVTLWPHVSVMQPARRGLRVRMFPEGGVPLWSAIRPSPEATVNLPMFFQLS